MSRLASSLLLWYWTWLSVRGLCWAFPTCFGSFIVTVILAFFLFHLSISCQSRHRLQCACFHCQATKCSCSWSFASSCWFILLLVQRHSWSIRTDYGWRGIWMEFWHLLRLLSNALLLLESLPSNLWKILLWHIDSLSYHTWLLLWASLLQRVSTYTHCDSGNHSLFSLDPLDSPDHLFAFFAFRRHFPLVLLEFTTEWVVEFLFILAQ